MWFHLLKYKFTTFTPIRLVQNPNINLVNKILTYTSFYLPTRRIWPVVFSTPNSPLWPLLKSGCTYVLSLNSWVPGDCLSLGSGGCSPAYYYFLVRTKPCYSMHRQVRDSVSIGASLKKQWNDTWGGLAVTFADVVLVS